MEKKAETKKTIGQQMDLAGLYGLTDPELARKMILGDGSNRITGQIMAMDKGTLEDGRHLFCIFGVVASTEESFKDLHQYPVVGKTLGFEKIDRVNLHIGIEEGEDKSKEVRGMGVSGILTSPNWRV